MKLVTIVVVTGVFSALFGVGGGIIVVPLLVLVLGFGERPAMATSLAAIGVIALAGTVSYALRGDVDPGGAALVGIPAAVGATLGATLQQRIATRTLSLAFAALLVAVAARLLVS